MKRKLFLLLCALLTSVGMWANQTLADNGVYYIQNVETGLFLSRGGAYGAHALADNYGLAWRLTGTNGSITLQMYDIYSEGFTAGGLGGDSFVDNGSPLTNWTLEGDANGYTIKTGSTYLTASGNTAGSDVVIDGNGTGNKTWILLSDAEHAAVLAAKTSAQESAIATTAGIDLGTSTLSEILGNTSNWRTSNIPVAAPTSSGVWTYTENRDQGGANNYGDYGTELYNKSGKFTKTISNLENGIYKLTVRSMHRSTHNAPCWTVGESFTNHTNSYVLANGYYAQLKDWKSAAEKNGDNYNPNSTGQFKNKVEAGNYATDIYTYVSNGTLDITVSQEGFWYGEWFAFNGVTLTYYSDQVSDEEAIAILATADALLLQEMDAAIKADLLNARNTFDGERTIANYNALQAAINAAQNSADAYALFAPERTKALALGMSAEAIAALAPDVNALKVAEYNFVTTNYQYGVALGEWTSTGTNTSAATFNNEHWSGETHDYKNQSDAGGQGWNADSWSINFSQDVTLPAGRYVFKVAGRQASGDQVTTSLVVKKGDEVLGTVNDFPRSNNSRGINKNGETDFEGDNSEFANGGKGFGWEWRYVKFELADPATVNIAVNSVATAIHQWVSFGDYTLQTDDEDNVELMEALVSLNDAIYAAGELTRKNENLGEKAFQFSATAESSLWGAFETAQSAAEAFVLTSSSTAEQVNGLATALTEAISNYKNQPLIAPAENDVFYLKRAGSDCVANLSTIKLTDEIAPVHFTSTEGGYKISSDKTNYVAYTGENTWSLTTNTTGAVWTVAYVSSGKYTLSSTYGRLGTDNADSESAIYGNKKDSDGDKGLWYICDATANMAVNATAKWGTFCAPFEVAIPSGVTAYTCESATGGVLNLTPQESTIPANTPVILNAESGLTSTTFYGVKVENETSDLIEGGMLVGNVGTAAKDVPSDGSAYLLQRNDGKTGFYQVNATGFKIGYNRCYLVQSNGGNARDAFFFEDEDPTAINEVEAVEAKAQGLKDGKYLINSRIVVVKNGKAFSANGQILK